MGLGDIGDALGGLGTILGGISGSEGAEDVAAELRAIRESLPINQFSEEQRQALIDTLFSRATESPEEAAQRDFETMEAATAGRRMDLADALARQMRGALNPGGQSAASGAVARPTGIVGRALRDESLGATLANAQALQQAYNRQGGFLGQALGQQNTGVQQALQAGQLGAEAASQSAVGGMSGPTALAGLGNIFQQAGQRRASRRMRRGSTPQQQEPVKAQSPVRRGPQRSY